MQKLNVIVKYALILVLMAAVVVGVLMLLGPLIGETFSTINSCLNCPPSTSGPTAVPGPTSTPPIASNNQPSLSEQLNQIDQALGQSMQSSFAYNSPSSMNLGDTVTIQLLLNPSVSPEQLGSQVTESGAVNTGALEITARMKAELIALDPDAFVIHAIPEDPIQLMSTKETTKWEWYVTAKRDGLQSLTLVIYRLIRYEGQDSWREVEAYKANINVNVTIAQRIESLDWKWIAGIIITAVAIPAFWRWIDSRKKKSRKR